MALRFAVPKKNDKLPSVKSKKKFAPWETVFDEMFELWFGIDFPSRAKPGDAVAVSRS